MKIVVVGAGLAGLASAHRAKQFGHDVLVLEASDRAAGRAKTLQRPDTNDLIDVGTQYFHSNYRRAISLIKEMGLASELRKVKGKTRFFDDRVPTGTFTSGHRIPYIQSGSFWQNVSMSAKGLLQMAGNPIDPYAVLPETAIDHFPAGDKVSDPFQWEYQVRALVAAGALVEPEIDTISYLHLIRLMRIVVMTDYLTLDRGIASLHEELANRLDIRFGSPVSDLVIENEEIKGVLLSNGETLSADCVFLAVPPNALAKILPNDWKNEQSYLSGVKHPPAMTVSLFLNSSLEASVWSYVFRPDVSRLVSFCVDTSQKNRAMAPSGNATLQAWICSPAVGRLSNQSDEAVIANVADELSSNFDDLASKIVGGYVHRVEYAVPQTPPGHNQAAQSFLNAVDRRVGLEVLGDHLSGGYMECALWSAERAVKRL